MANRSPIVQSQYLGLYTLRSAQEIARGFAALAINSDHSSSSAVGPFQGYSEFGNQENVSDVITRKYTYQNGLGFETMLHVRDNATTSILEYLNRGDVRNSENGEWLPLVEGLATAIKSDGTVNKRRVMGFTAFNDTGTDNLLFCNGSNNFSRWSGAHCCADGAISAGGATITVKKVPNDPKTNATDGFPASGSLTYRDTTGTVITVTYSGKTGSTFTGCSGATASADTTGIAHVADTSTYSSVPKNNILDTAQGRVVAAGRDDAPNQVDLSRVSDFTDWTTSITPDDAQSLDFPEGGSITGLSHIDDWIFVLKEKESWSFTFVPTQVSDGAGGYVEALNEQRKRISRAGCVNQKAVANVNDDVWFMTPQGQVRRLFRLEGERGFSTEDMVEVIRPTLRDFVWDDGAMEYWEKERIVICSGRSDDSVTVNDKAIVIQSSKNEDGTTRVNHGILDWFIGDMAVYNDRLHFGSSIESKNFLAFDGFSKDGAPYDWVRTERIEVFPEVSGNTNSANFIKKNVQYLMVLGTIASGATLEMQLDYNINGSLGIISMSLNGTDEAYIIEQPLNTLNAFALNTEPLNGTRTALSSRNPFMVIFPLPNEYLPYNVQLTFKTSGTGQDVEILSHGFIVSDAGQHIDSEILKGLD